jgi:hypothetical protein
MFTGPFEADRFSRSRSCELRKYLNALERSGWVVPHIALVPLKLVHSRKAEGPGTTIDIAHVLPFIMFHHMQPSKS